MPHLSLPPILDGATGITREGSAYLLGEDLEATLFISLGQEVLQVGRLSRIELGSEVVTLLTHKSERFFFPLQQIIGLRLGGDANRGSRSAAGFR
jgi:hypothetical protein